MNKIKSIIIFFITILMIYPCLLGEKNEKILLNLRFYEGQRTRITKTKDFAISFFVEPYFVGNINSQQSIIKEKDKIKSIFNVENTRLITKSKWIVKTEPDTFNISVLNTPNLLLNIEFIKNQIFKITVFEDPTQSRKNIFETELNLPEEKSTIYGFEYSKNKIYFLSLHRAKNTKVIDVNKLRKIVKNYSHSSLPMKGIPELKQSPSPEFSKESLKGKSGEIILLGFADQSGEVTDIKVLEGVKGLTKTAVDTVSKWKYEPLILNNEKIPFIFTVVFSLPELRQRIFRTTTDYIPSIWPTTGYLTDSFGWRKNPKTGERDFHNGQDIATNLGREVVATANGTVIVAENQTFIGNVLYIDHNYGYITLYGHLQKFVVKPGDYVKRGEVIGYVGQTGISNSPHLHYGILLNDKAVNPMDYIWE